MGPADDFAKQRSDGQDGEPFAESFAFFD
jgi:hypothetical protein